MSNAKVIPNMKGHGSTVRRAPAAANLRMWTADRKATAGMPLLRLNRVMEFVDANLAFDLCVPRLATVAGMSPYYFCRAFKQQTGITPHRYVLQRRMEQARRLLEEKAGSLLEIARRVGFADQSQFTRVFRKLVGVTPSIYRKIGVQHADPIGRSN